MYRGFTYTDNHWTNRQSCARYKEYHPAKMLGKSSRKARLSSNNLKLLVHMIVPSHRLLEPSVSSISFLSGFLGEDIDGATVDISRYLRGCGEVAFRSESLGCPRSRSTIAGAGLLILKRAYTVLPPLPMAEDNLKDGVEV